VGSSPLRLLSQVGDRYRAAVAISNLTIQGFRIRRKLQAGLEDIFARDAQTSADRYLESVLAGQSRYLEEPEGERHGIITYTDDVITSARESVRSGGHLSWSRFEVTDQMGITRFQDDYGTPRNRPDLADAAMVELQLEAGYIGTSRSVATVSVAEHRCDVRLDADNDRIESLRGEVAALLETFVENELLPAPPTFKVFIGHGGDPQWKYLHRALNDNHGILAEAFESAERAGYHTLSVVDQMVRSSAVAVVVMTGELMGEDGILRARENVVHEVGFCQGALGISQTIVVLEDGVSEPSNIAGLTQVRFPRGRLIDVEDRIVDVIKQRQQVHAYQQG
jgi:predicted nucleotide-binding protein